MIYETRICATCKRGTPHSKRGCTVCRKKIRMATRIAKRSMQGAPPLVRFGALLKQADDLWSVMIRAAATGCAYCAATLPPEKLQWAHHWTRAERRIRYHPDNSSALCSPCHRRNTPPGVAWVEWVEARLGPERTASLRLASKVGPKLSTSLLQVVMLEAALRIFELPPGPRKDWALERHEKISARNVRVGS